jgi:flagellar motor switch protein FliN/FliY
MANESEQIGQDEIEELLRQAASPKPAAPAAAPTVPAAGDVGLGQDEIEALLKSGVQAGAAPVGPAPKTGQGDIGLDQSEIEALLGKSAARMAPAQASPGSSKAAAAAPSQRPGVGKGVMQHSDIELLLTSAQQALASVAAESEPMPVGVKPFHLEDFAGSPPSTEMVTLELIRDVEFDLKIELGRTHMYLEDVLKLRKGSVVPLDKLAGDPVDIYVNGRLIARGEVLVLNDNFCVRVAELVAGERVGAA